jgi:hypothetical protein
MLKGFYIAFALALLVATTAFAWGQITNQRVTLVFPRPAFQKSRRGRGHTHQFQ